MSDAPEQARDDRTQRVGQRVRQLRVEAGMTAKEVCQRAGVSAAYLSRLESGQLNPTVSTLSKVMDAMRQPLWRCFAEGSQEGPVVRKADRAVIYQGSGVVDALITPGREGRLEIVETTISPDGESGGHYSHWNEEECILMLDGSLDFWLREERFELRAGDSITFSSRIPHKWVNSSGEEATALWIITPGGMAGG